MFDNNAILSYRNVVSRVYRLSMLIAAAKHETAADVFDGLLDDLARFVQSGNQSADTHTLHTLHALDEFLERDLPSPKSPPVELADTHVVPVHMIVHEEPPMVHVEKMPSPLLAPLPSPEPTTDVTHAESEDTFVDAEEGEAEGEAVSETSTVVPVDPDEGEVVDAAEEEEEEEVEVVEEEEEVEEAAEEEEVEDAAEEEEETTEEEEEVEVAEEEEEVEVTEEEEEAEEEEASYEQMRIGNKNYFVDTTTNSVFAFISEEEAGDYVGKLVNGKLVRAA